jgi:hypothetical protein
MDLYFFFLDYCFNPMSGEDAAEFPPKAIVNARLALPKDSEGRATLKVAYGDQVSSPHCSENVSSSSPSSSKMKKKWRKYLPSLQRHKIYLIN